MYFTAGSAATFVKYFTAGSKAIFDLSILLLSHPQHWIYVFYCWVYSNICFKNIAPESAATLHLCILLAGLQQDLLLVFYD